MNPIDFILHIDKYIGMLIDKFGAATYLILFLIIFAETGLVLTPFLPGDSLLFIVGTFASQGYFNIMLTWILLCIAAILGDSANYTIGNLFGKKLLKEKNLIKKEHLKKTDDFYEKYGAKTIIIARFVPIVRTLAPFVAGIGKMEYKKFLTYNVVGGIFWVTLFTLAGYFFGGIPFVQKNLTPINPLGLLRS